MMNARAWQARVWPVCLAILLCAGWIVSQAAKPAAASGTLPSASEIIAALKAKHPGKGHPRIMATADDFADMRQRIAADSFAADLYDDVKADADAILSKPLPVYSSNLLNTSRQVLNDVRKLGIVAQVEQGSNKTPYVEKAWDILEAAGNFPDWNPSHFLDVAEMTMAFAIGYDWFYHEWTSSRRAILLEAIVDKGLQPALDEYNNNTAWWADVTHNWNTVVNGGISNGALAVADESSALESLAGELLELALAHVQKVLPSLAPDGGGEEGTGYWRYNMEYYVNFVSSLQSALGDDYGMTDAPGLAETAYFPIIAAGPKGSFNYGDNYTEVIRNPIFFWFAEQFDNDDFAKHRMAQLTATVSPAPAHELDLLWYRPGISAPYTPDLELDGWFEGIDVGAMRSAWNDPNALFVAFKGGSNQFNHSHLDHGTFVLDALGVRWAEDLGPDDYELPGYFDNRSQYYRLRTEGHNTLVLNPGLADGQRSNGVSHIYQTYSSSERSHMIVDMTHAYSDHAAKVKRGFALIDNRTKFLLQDEIKLKAPGQVYWFMHTQADIDIRDGGRSALLSATAGSQTKYLWVRILNDNLVFEELDPVPLPTSPDPSGQASNPGKKLTIHATDIDELQLAVLFVPLPDGPTPPSAWPQVRDLKDWAAETHAPILYPAADGFVRGGDYANDNYGSENGIELKNDSSANFKREGYMKFDVSDVHAPIVSAKLVLNARAPDGSATLGVYRASGSWEEHTLTWNTKPAAGALIDSAWLSNAFEWHELDITDYVQERQAGDGIVNLALLQILDPDVRTIRIQSREHNDMPYLELVTAPVPSVPKLELFPTADAHVQDGSYAGVNFGNANPLVVKHDPVPDFSREAFLRFDVSSAGGPIASAKLYVHARVNDHSNATLGVYESAGGWAENSVNWNTKPSVGNLLGSAALTATYRWHAVDITSYVQAQQAGSGLVHLALKQDLDPSARAINVHSREEASYKPYLEITLE